MLRTGLMLVLLAATARTVFADDLARHIRMDYAKKTFLLRNFYQDRLLHYDQLGKLKNSGQVGSWTTSFVYIKSIEVSNDAVQMKGQRVVQVFDPKGRRFEAVRSNLDVLLRIENDLVKPSSEEQLTKALAAVFVDPHEPFAPLVPDFWRWVVNHFKYEG